MLALGTEPKIAAYKKDKGGSYFHLRPAPGSREFALISNEQSGMIQHKTFVTNSHVLIQFKKEKHPAKNANGTVREQTAEDAKTDSKTPETVILASNGSIVS